MELGYARISTPTQSLDLQLDALKSAGVERVWEEVGSGRKTDRPELTDLLSFARQGDRITVYSLSRFGRRTVDTLQLIEGLAARGVEFRSITEGVDTASPSGRFQITLLAALAALEQEVLSERVRAGLVAAAARGRVGGRPKALDHVQAGDIRQAARAGETVAALARRYGVSRATVYRALA